MRRFAFCALLATTSISFACTAPSKGALILAISTDMQAPKDIDVVSLYIETNGVVKFDYMGRVLPNGTVSLPSTLALVEPDELNAQVHIRVTAFQTQSDGSAKARVLRDVLTTIPHERTALLRLPLDFLDDGSVTGTLPAMYVPDPANGVPEGDTTYGPTDPVSSDPGYLTPACDYDSQQLTSVAGSCVSANFDSSQAPVYADNEVFGDGGTATVPACFAVANCFQQKTVQQNIAMASDGSCNFPIAAGENGQDWNCALATTDGTGTCIGQNGLPPCLVPLESDPGEGFTIVPGQQDQMGQVTMVPGVCKKLMAGAQLYLDKSSCPTKVEAAPVCQPGATGGSTGQGEDAGAAPTDAEAFPDASIQADDASSCVGFGGACTSTPQCCGSNSSCSFSAKGGTCMPFASGSDGGVPPQDSGTTTGTDAASAPDGAAP